MGAVDDFAACGQIVRCDAEALHRLVVESIGGRGGHHDRDAAGLRAAQDAQRHVGGRDAMVAPGQYMTAHDAGTEVEIPETVGWDRAGSGNHLRVSGDGQGRLPRLADHAADEYQRIPRQLGEGFAQRRPGCVLDGQNIEAFPVFRKYALRQGLAVALPGRVAAAHDEDQGAGLGMDLEGQVCGAFEGDFFIDARGVVDSRQIVRAETVESAKDDRDIREQSLAIFDDEVERGVVRQHHQVGMVGRVFCRHRLGQRFHLGAVGESPAVQVFVGNLDALAGSVEALPESLLDPVAPLVPPMVGVDEDHAVIRAFRGPGCGMQHQANDDRKYPAQDPCRG